MFNVGRPKPPRRVGAGFIKSGIWGKHPIAPARLPVYNYTMKTNCRKRYLTFGEVIMAVYDACGRQKAEGIVRLAVNGRLLKFRGHDHFVILEPGLDNLFSVL